MIEREKRISVAADVQPICRPELTGIGRVMQELVRGLSARTDLAIRIQGAARSEEAAADAKANLPFLAPEQLRLRRMNPRIAYALYMVFPFLYRLLFEKSDVFVSFNYMLPRGVAGKKLIFVHDMTVKRYPETMEPVMRRVLELTLASNCRRADRVLTISEFSKNEICELLPVPREKVAVIPLAVDRDKFHTNYTPQEIDACKSGLGIRGPYLLYVGTLEPRKNITGILDAYAKVSKRQRALPQLVVAGKKGWLYDGIFRHLEELQIAERVVFTDFVPDAQLPLLMAGARAFLFPSLYEGFGLPPLEAMACGTPVLCCNVASLPEVVGDAAITVDPFDTDEIADGIERLVTDDALCASLREKGLKRAQLFDWKISTERLAEEIESVL